LWGDIKLPFTSENFAMAKKCWSLYMEEPDLDRKIKILEISRNYVDYIPNLIILGKYYSIRAKINQLKKEPREHYNKEKYRAEIVFNYLASSINEKNNPIFLCRSTIHNHNLYYEWGEHNRRWEEYSQAIDKYQRAIKEINQYKKKTETDERIDITCRFFIATCYIELKDFQKAKEIFDDIKNINPHHPFLITGLGEYFMRISMDQSFTSDEKIKNFIEAEKQFNKAIENQPENYYPYWCLSKLFVEQDDIEKGQKFLEVALKKVMVSDNRVNELKIESDLENLKTRKRSDESI
jgi:tetratricopeptide (TPR) repeat protein